MDGTAIRMLGATLVVGLLALGGSSSCSAQAQGENATRDERAAEPPQTGATSTTKMELSEEEWRRRLTSEQFSVLRQEGTECAFTGALLQNKSAGVYRCAGCGQELFDSQAKFTSGTGWPSFHIPFAPGRVVNVQDNSHGMSRVEVRCSRCGGHLGHVFTDGPAPTGLRYCINSAALTFQKQEAPYVRVASKAGHKVAMFGAGCFWGVESTFRAVDGVVDTAVGFSGGTVPDPGYRRVCRGDTGHAEVVLVTYDPSKVTYEQLLDTFWNAHDPTQGNRQGWDVGSQYRSAIYTFDDVQKEAALASKNRLEESGRLDRRITTEIAAAGPFYRAEEYHQQYYQKRGLKGCPVK